MGRSSAGPVQAGLQKAADCRYEIQDRRGGRKFRFLDFHLLRKGSIEIRGRFTADNDDPGRFDLAFTHRF